MKNRIYQYLRKQVAKRATGNLGNVFIFDEKIVCYVDGRKLKQKEKYTHRYNLIFRCIPSKEEIYRTYNVDKPVHYIIEDVDFDREINIRTSIKNCHVTFDNCTFTGAIEIDFADHITFIHNIYEAQNHKNFYSIYKEGEFCISTKTNKNEINKIEFISDDIDVDYPDAIPMFRAVDKKTKKKDNKKPIIKIWLYAKEIIMTKTDIVEAESLEIGTDNLILNKVNISSKEIEADATNLESHYFNSEIKSDIISVKTNSYFGKLIAKYKTLFVNGIEINKNESDINEETIKLQKQRLELINSLKKIETRAEEQISQRLKKESLTKILKK